MLKSLISAEFSRCAVNILKPSNIRRFTSASAKLKEDSTNAPSTGYIDFIQKRMQQATNSILLQVESDQCYNNAFHHCKQFGDIATAIAYKSPDNRDFLLLEYSSADGVNGILNNAAFQSDVIPWKNHYMTYRHTNRSISASESIDTPIQFEQFKAASNLSKSISESCTFDDQIMQVYEHLRPSDLQQRLRCLASLQVENVLSHYAHDMFPHGKIIPFGSSFHGFGTFDTNLDMTLQYADRLVPPDDTAALEYYGKDYVSDDNAIAHGGRQIKFICWLLDYFIPESANISPMGKSIPPLGRYFDAYTQCRLDVSVNNVYGLRETELLYALNQLDARVKPFVLLVHKWAEGKGIAKVAKGSFYSIQLTYLALHFLQHSKQPLLPPLEELYTIHNADQPTVAIDIQPFDFKTDNTNSTSELFREFLEYYSALDVSKYVVSMRTSDPVLKPVNNTTVVKETRRKPKIIPMYMEKIFFPNGNFAENITDYEYQLFLSALQKTMSDLDEYHRSDKKEILDFLL